MPKLSEYLVRTSNGPITVVGWPIEIKGFPNLIVHRAVIYNSDPKGPRYIQSTHRLGPWTVTETTTGMSVVEGDRWVGRLDVIADADRRLTRVGVAKFTKIVKKLAKDNWRDK